MDSKTKLCKRPKTMDIGQGKTYSGETRADCGLWDDGENKEGGSAKLTVYLSL